MKSQIIMPITYKIMTTLIFIIFSITFSNIASHFFSIFLQFCTLILSITVEFPNAKYRRKQIKVHLNLPVEKMGHLYRVIKQHVIGIKCRNSLPIRTQDNYKHKHMGGKTAMYGKFRCTFICLRLYLAFGNSTVITVLHTIYTILLTIISDAYMTYNSFK
jgi:hypothetical protein